MKEKDNRLIPAFAGRLNEFPNGLSVGSASRRSGIGTTGFELSLRKLREKGK